MSGRFYVCFVCRAKPEPHTKGCNAAFCLYLRINVKKLRMEQKRKQGQPKKIKTPEVMWELFQRYCYFIKTHPIIVHDFVGGAGNEVERRMNRCLTMEGFENFVADLADDPNEPNYPYSLDQYFGNYTGGYGAFVDVCSRIRRKIRQEQIEGGMARVYSNSITQRLNNLVEKREVTKHKEQPLFADVRKALHKEEAKKRKATTESKKNQKAD